MGCTIVKNHHEASVEMNLIKASSMNLRSSVIENTHTSNLEDYFSLSFLGAGAFAEVLATRHALTNTCRALKIINKLKFNQSTLKPGGFPKESVILAKLNHPNIIKFYEVFEDTLNFYIITELCKGGTLGKRLKSQQKFSEDTVVEVIRQVLDAIEYLHALNIVHRDIKLENILLTDLSSYSIKIADFGCSLYLQPGQILKDCSGSLYYLAPEILKGNYTEKVDIWSCGILAIIMLTGAFPYLGTDKEEIKTKIKEMTRCQILEKVPQISSDGQDLIRQMLEIDPNVRISAEKARKHAWLNK